MYFLYNDFMKSWQERIIEYGTLFLTFFTPVLYFGKILYYPYLASKIFFFYAGVEILFALWLYIIITNSTYRFPKQALLFFIPVELYLLQMTLAGIFGINPELSFWSTLSRGTGLLTWYHLFAFSLIIASLVYRQGVSYVRKLLNFFVGGAFIVALSVWLGDEGFNVPLEFFQKSKGGGLIGNSSLAASYLLFALFFGLFLFFQKSAQKKSKAWVVAVSLFILSSPLFFGLYHVFTGNGRIFSALGGTLGIAAGAIFTWITYLYLSNKKITRIIAGAVTTLALIASFFGLSQIFTPGTILNQQFQTLGGNRVLFWNIGKTAMAERPWFGFGPENYKVVYQKYFDPHVFLNQQAAEVYADRAHNIFFDTGVSGGWPAVLFYTLFLLSLLCAAHYTFKHNRISRIQTAIFSGLLAGYLLQNLLVFDSLFSLLGLFVLSGVLFGLAGEHAPDKERALNVTISGFIRVCSGIIITILTILSLLFFSIRPISKAHLFSWVLQMPLETRPNYYLDLVSGSAIGNADDVGQIANTIYVQYAVNKEKIKKDNKLLPYAVKDLEKILEYFQTIATQEPTDYRLHINIGKLYNIYTFLADKQKDIALQERTIGVLKYAETLSPTDPEVDWAMGQTFLYAGKVFLAEEALKRGIDKAPFIADSYRILLHVAEGTGNTKLYAATLEEAKQAIPGFIFEGVD